MAKCYRNDVGSIVLDRNPVTVGNHFRLWRSAFRRKIFAAVSCGGGSRQRQELREEEDDAFVAGTSTTQTIGEALNGLSFREKPKSDEREKKKQTDSVDGGVKKKTTVRLSKQGKSEKLSDLLSIAEAEADVETRKKEEALEDLKRVVRDLQVEAVRLDHDSDDVTREMKLAAARKVRLLAKEDSEARVTLALLGAIPPLVGMIDDSEDADTQIASLYALLNLGIGNDA